MLAALITTCSSLRCALPDAQDSHGQLTTCLKLSECTLKFKPPLQLSQFRLFSRGAGMHDAMVTACCACLRHAKQALM